MRTSIVSVLVSFSLCTAATSVCAGAALIEHVSPAGVEPGKVTRITLFGTELAGATALWSTLPSGNLAATLIEATDDSVTFDVDVPADVRLGIYGFRVATRSGLSNAHLFAIDDLPTVFEHEAVGQGSSNSTLLTAQTVSLPAVISGTSPASDVDHYAFDVTAGQRVSFEVVGSRLGKAYDPVITILDQNGRSVAEQDNDIGLFFDFRFAHTFAQAGSYTVKLHDSRYHGSPHWTYLLRIGRFPVTRVALPSTVQPGHTADVRFPGFEAGPRQVAVAAGTSADRFFYGLRGETDEGSVWLPMTVSTLANKTETEPNNSADQATETPFPVNIHGLIDRPGDEDWFEFELSKGNRLELRAETRTLGSAADIELALFNQDGRELKRADDSGFDDAAFSWSAPADGRYRLRVAEVVQAGGVAYGYRIELARRVPKLRMVSEIGRMATPRGSWQPLPLVVDRTDFADEIQLTLVGAPEGMTLRDDTVPAGSKEFTGALLVDPSVPEGMYTLQVMGTSRKDGVEISAIAETSPLIDRKPTGRGPHGEAFELREDQRRLPPSLTDRIAVLVLPESPYDFAILPQVVTLPRYVHATFQIQTRFRDAFTGPVSFEARGGQLDPVRLQSPSITAEIGVADGNNYLITGTLRSGVNTQTNRHRVTVTGTASHEGRTINLTRTFELDTQVAFNPSATPDRIELSPGQSAKVTVAANRLPAWDGPLTIVPTAPAGITLPAMFELAAGIPDMQMEIGIAADLKPGTYEIKLAGTTRIGKFAERRDGGKLVVVVAEPTSKTVEPAE